MNIEEVLQTFIAESRDQLDAMEAALLAIESNAVDSETIHGLFRAAHTIKGSAGLFQLEHIVSFAHAVESVLDAARDGRLSLDAELVALLMPCRDHLGLLIDAVAAGQVEPEESSRELGAPLIEKLHDCLARNAAARASAAAAAPNGPGTRATDEDESAESWNISLRFGPAVLEHGMDPLSFLRHLQGYGKIVNLVTLFDALPPPEQMDPRACYLGFEIAFRTSKDLQTIENVFELVRDECELRILPKDRARPGEIGKPSVPPAVVATTFAKQKQVKEAKALDQRSVRVDADKLDGLINLVGELIIAAAGASLVARRVHEPELEQNIAGLSTLVEAVRDHALQLRMVRIAGTFQRFRRVVYDVSRDLGKDIELVLEGEEAELDKTVVERIGDPLMHLVRNAIDHGIEPPEVRAARGKPRTGSIRLNAFHDSGSIVIQVSDDGAGLHRSKILTKAVERGLVEPGRSLSEDEIHNLIFEPGFSTADQITDLSGRGVGMDVVKQNITALRGSVSVASVAGRGTTVSVRLPLTLAIINGFLVGLGKALFVLPLDMIEECLELGEHEQDYATLRGNILPYIRLGELFQIEAATAARQNVVVVRSGAQRAGLVVDTLLGEFQTVIKPLGKMFSRVKCISGSTILGSGEVALILDVPTLLQQAAQGAVMN